MTNNSRLMVMLFLLFLPLISAVQSVWAVDGAQLPLRHPDEGDDLRMCTQCHAPDDEAFPFRRYNHTLLFGERHQAVARSGQPVCEMCHQPSYCSSCHGVGVELKPSQRKHGDPRLRTPHRGDYLTRHRIDGSLNPASCFRCHGTPKSSRMCAPCHG